jgi:DNA-binding MarR family transcriptional regulator
VEWLTRLRKEGIIKPVRPGHFWLYSEEQIQQIPSLIAESRKCLKCGKLRPPGTRKFCRECSPQYRKEHPYKALSPEEKVKRDKRGVAWRKANPEKQTEISSRVQRKYRAKCLERTDSVVSRGNYLTPGIEECAYLRREAMKNYSATDQDYNLWILLAQTRDAILKARQKELDQYGISTSQAAVLFVIQAIGDRATPAEISRWLFREPHSVSTLLSRMEKQGLVRKVKDLDRKNLVRVVITEKGREAYYQSTKRESIRGIMSSLSEEERQQLTSSLRKLRDEALKRAVSLKPPVPSPVAALGVIGQAASHSGKPCGVIS